MNSFVLWRSHHEASVPIEMPVVANRLRQALSPVFGVAGRIRTCVCGPVNLAWFELPNAKWLPATIQEDKQTWVFASEYPSQVTALLASYGDCPATDQVLPTLCRRLQANPKSVLRELAPPFLLVWMDKASGKVYIQQDGLGTAQAMCFDDGRNWAVADRVLVLRALDLALQPEPLHWAVRLTLGWFPGTSTGFRHLSQLLPGTRFEIDAGGIRRTLTDVISDWVHPPAMSDANALELARESVYAYLRAVNPLMNQPSLGLSGGFDSRAIAAIVLAQGIKCHFRCRGLADRPDVIVAKLLAEIAGIELHLKDKTDSSLPPKDPATIRTNIDHALLWQGGNMVTHKHKSFRQEKLVNNGSVNIMGQHGEIARAYYLTEVKQHDSDDHALDQALLRHFMGKMPLILGTDWREPVARELELTFRQADLYGVKGMARLHFFYLFERTRRWASGSLASQTSQVIAPFLNPNFVRATYAVPNMDLTKTPFQQNMVTHFMPAWAKVPYASALPLPKKQGPNETLDWRRSVGNSHYDQAAYWRSSAQILIEEAIKDPGWAAKLLDLEATRDHWQEAPDALAMLHAVGRVWS